MVLAQGEWKPIHRVHSIGILYKYWKSLINPRLDELKEMTKYKADWTIVDGADDWVKTIEGVDLGVHTRAIPQFVIRGKTKPNRRSKWPPRRNYFRKTAPEDRRIMALIIENDDHEFVRGYMNERGVEPDQAYSFAD